MRNLIFALLVGGTVYFLVNWWVAMREHRRMTEIEKRNAQIEDDKRVKARRNPKEHFVKVLTKYGYKGDIGTALVGMGFLYLVVTVALAIIGINGIVGAIVGLPATAGTSFGVLSWARTRRHLKFNVQLMQALTLLAGQLESGNGPTRALEQIIPSLQDPLRSELTQVLNSTIASQSIVEALGELVERYQSRALAMYIAALSLEGSGQIAPALRQAANILQRDFELAEEAMAELSQTKAETIGVVCIVVGIAVIVYTGGDAATRAAYVTPVGIMAVVGGAANFFFGIFRAVRIFQKVKPA